LRERFADPAIVTDRIKDAASMYVCLCNALRCRDIKAAAENGARDTASAFKACGAKPRWGRCLEEAGRMIAAIGAAPAHMVPAE